MNSFTETDHDSDDAFQLGVRSAAQYQRLNVAGTSRRVGWILTRTECSSRIDHEIANEDLMDFNWHDVLPHTIRSHHPYRVEELMINEASDTTSFKLIDTENNRAIDMFDAGIFERWSWSHDGYQGSRGLKIAASVVNERMELDWNEYEKIKRQREADRDSTDLAAVEIVFKSEDMSEHFEDSGQFKGTVSLVDADGLILEDDVTTMREANAYFNEREDDWQREHEMALSFFSTDIPEGSKILFEFDESDVEVLEIGPLIYEERVLSDHWDNDAYQLDVRVNGEKHFLEGEASVDISMST